MIKCRYCQTISNAAPDDESGSTACRLCGSLDFIDISEDELRQTMKRLTRRERCCPNSSCELRLLTNEDNYCSRCGRATEKTSLDLWIQKCVEPAFIADPARIFTEIESLIEAARKMGFPAERSTPKLEEFFRQSTREPFQATVDWVAKIRKRLESFPSTYYAGRSACKKLYEAACAGETVVGFVLGTQTPVIDEQNDSRKIIFLKNFNGRYLGFYDKANCKELWIFPIPNLEFSKNGFYAVFSDLTEGNYKTGNFEPRKAFIIRSGKEPIWVLSSITENRKRLLPELAALADELGLTADFAGKILKIFFP